MNRYGLHGHLQAIAGKGAELAEILLEASQLVSSAKGCHLYVVSTDELKPDAVFVTEIWDSKEDHDQSLNVPGVKELIGRAMPILAGPPQRGQVLSILGGAGLAKSAGA